MTDLQIQQELILSNIDRTSPSPDGKRNIRVKVVKVIFDNNHDDCDRYTDKYYSYVRELTSGANWIYVSKREFEALKDFTSIGVSIMLVEDLGSKVSELDSVLAQALVSYDEKAEIKRKTEERRKKAAEEAKRVKEQAAKKAAEAKAKRELTAAKKLITKYGDQPIHLGINYAPLTSLSDKELLEIKLFNKLLETYPELIGSGKSKNTN